MSDVKSSSVKKKPVTLALQGGASFGSFTWGVIDKLLEDGRFEIQGITGTSAGAMNAICVVNGLMKGGNEGARKQLEDFWMGIAHAGKSTPMISHRDAFTKMMGAFTMQFSPGAMIMEQIAKFMSPYDLNPFDVNPLKDVITKQFDFEGIRNYKECQAFLCATHVKTGKIRIFKNHEMKAECLLASACLPSMFKAVKVDDEYYWDGGYIGNPVFFPLIYNCETPDIILVQLEKTHDPKIPQSVSEIQNRLKQITWNTSIVREMRSIAFISDLIDRGIISEEAHMKRVFMHVIENPETFDSIDESAKVNTEEEFLKHLFNEGRQTAEKWIKANYDKVGKESSAPIKDLYVGQDFDGHI
jgi:NTE family protein